MTDDGVFAAGQVWTYRGAPRESSRVVVGKVDRLDVPGSQSVVSISITDVQLADPRTGKILQDAIFHCPIAAETLTASVIARDGLGEPSEGFESGYDTWREEMDSGEAGFFTIPVCEIIELYRGMIAGSEAAK